MTEAEAEGRNKKTGVFARTHMETMRTGAFFHGLWHRGHRNKKKDGNTEEKEKTVCKLQNEAKISVTKESFQI